MINFIILFLCIAIIIMYILRKNSSFIGFNEVLKIHFSIYKNSKSQIAFFYVLPLIMAICMTNLGALNQQIVDNIIIVLGIFVAVFFSILGFILGFPKKVNNNTNENTYLVVHRETFCTTLFEIFLCIITLILAFTYVFFPEKQLPELGKDIPLILLYCWSFLIYYLLLACLLNMFILMKRLKKLYDAQ